MNHEEIEKQDHIPASLPQSDPTCPVCGTVVSKKGQLCSADQAQRDARPRPMFDTGKHPEPPQAETESGRMGIPGGVK